MRDAETFCLSVRDKLACMTGEQKRDFLKLVVDKVGVDEQNKLEIQLIIPRPDKRPADTVCETAFSLTKERGKENQEGASAS